MESQTLVAPVSDELQASEEALERQDKEREQVTIGVKVNKKEVVFHVRRATGLEIKKTAIAQHVVIQEGFALFLVGEKGKLDPIADGQSVFLRRGMEFRAIAPDDNS